MGRVYNKGPEFFYLTNMSYSNSKSLLVIKIRFGKTFPNLIYIKNRWRLISSRVSFNARIISCWRSSEIQSLMVDTLKAY